MKNQAQFLLTTPLIIIIIIVFPITTHAKSMIEACSSSDSCASLLSYILPFDSQLSEIAFRFQVKISDILAANSINLTTPFPDNLIFHAKSLLKIPISCPCVDGIRRSMSTTYNVRPADTVDSISEGFGGLVSGDQISSSNGISVKDPLMNGQALVIPLPCTCFNNSDNGVPAVFMSYVAQRGESLDGLAMEFGSTVAHLEAVNGLDQPVVQPGDVLAIPISACSSANLNWYNESLIVPNGSYALTANNCIKCICSASTFRLHCMASETGVSCSHLQCKGSDLFIGDTCVNRTANGCNLRACVYRGHYGRKIFRSLVNFSNVQCPGNTQSYNNGRIPLGSPSFNPVGPSIGLPPFSSPTSAPCAAVRSNASNSSNNHNFTVSTSGYFIINPPNCFISFLIQLIFCLFF